MKKSILSSVLLIGIAVLLIQGCGGGGDTDPSTDPPVVEPLTIEATEITRTTPSFRFHFLAFNLKSIDGGDAGRFKIVAKEKKDGEVAPTTQDMIDGAGVFRKVGGTDKPVILGFPISSQIGQFYDDTVAEGKRIPFVHHATTNVDQYLLKADTEYMLYAVKAADTGATIAADATVYTLTNLRTDPIPTSYDLASSTDVGNKDLLANVSSDTVSYYYDIEDTAIIIPAFVASIKEMVLWQIYTYDKTTGNAVDDLIHFSDFNPIILDFPNNTTIVDVLPAILYPSSATDGNGDFAGTFGTEMVHLPLFLFGSIAKLEQESFQVVITFRSVGFSRQYFNFVLDK